MRSCFQNRTSNLAIATIWRTTILYSWWRFGGNFFIIKALALAWLRFTNRKSLERGRRMKKSRVSLQKQLATYLNWRSRIARTTFDTLNILGKKWRSEIRAPNARWVNLQVLMCENKLTRHFTSHDTSSKVIQVRPGSYLLWKWVGFNPGLGRTLVSSVHTTKTNPS